MIYHEVSLDEGKLVGQALLVSVVGSALNLVVVVVETCDVCTGELGDLARWPAYAATDIENLHALLDADLMGKIVLMSGNGLVEALANRVPAEVEGLAPAVFVQISGEVVVPGRNSVN
jgi:hypothetical protein